MKKFLFSFFFLIFFYVGFTQKTVTISGKVVDGNDNPIPNVLIYVKGEKVQTYTNEKGEFTIENVVLTLRTHHLIASNINIVTKDVNLGDYNNYNDIIITVQSKVNQMDNMVVVGYGLTEKKKFTGSATNIDVDKFNTLVTPSVDQQLEGRAAGLQATSPGGAANVAARITIRGINSINNTQGPLWVVDGVPINSGSLDATNIAATNPISDIDPADIASIEVLKDGSSTAIYGARAAGGVILVTTKKGTKGAVRINYQAIGGFSQTSKRYSLLNNYQFVAINNEKFTNAGLAPQARDTTTNTNWQSQAYINLSPTTSHTISIAGGTEKSSYYLSLNYNSIQGSIFTNTNQAYRVRANVDQGVGKYFKVGNYVTLSRQYNTDQNAGYNFLGSANLGSLLLFPNVSPYANTPSGYNISSTANQFYNNGPNLSGPDANFFNIAYTLRNNTQSIETYRILNTSYIEAYPVKGLTIRSQLGIDYSNAYAFQSLNPIHGDGFPIGLVENTALSSLSYDWQNYATYNIGFKGHNFTITGGQEIQVVNTKYVDATLQNVIASFITKNIITGSGTIPAITGFYGTWGYSSVFGRLNYDYKSKYLLQASVRYDGQSALAPGKQYGVFPGVGIGWRPAGEDFWMNNKTLTKVFSDFKIKASYAVTGNILSGQQSGSNFPQVGYFPYLNGYSPILYGSNLGLNYSQFGNPNLQWETSQKYDVGLDMSFLKGRVSFTADYFYNNINNLVLNVPQPTVLGIPNNVIATNIGRMSNQGLELTASFSAFNTKNFGWDIGANFTTIRNRLEQLYSVNGKQVTSIPSTYNILQVGQSVNALWGYRWAGVNTQTGNPMYYKADGTLVQQRVEDGAFFAVKNKNDGSYANPTSALTSNDKTILGNTAPTWFGGINNSFRYKQWSLVFLFNFSGGNKIYNYTRANFLLNQNFWNNGTEILNRWTTPGQVTNVPRLYYGNGNIINQIGNASSRFVEDGSFLRLQNVVLTYTVAPRVLALYTKGVVKNFSLYAQGQNLFVLTAYTGLDPQGYTSNGFQQSTGSGTNTTAGVDLAFAPAVRTISFGLNVGF